MRVLILTSRDHMYANYLAKEVLLGCPNITVVAILESSVLLHGMSTWRALLRYLRTSGMRYVAAQTSKVYIHRAARWLVSNLRPGNVHGVHYDYRRLAASRGIPVCEVEDVNSLEWRNRIRATQPDVVLCLLFNQILGRRTIELAGKACANVHPAQLPSYRGVSPVFHALANGEKEVGVTLHQIDIGIDTGRPLARATVAVKARDTEHSLYARCCARGVELVKLWLGEGAAVPESQDGYVGEGSYYSLPTRSDVRRLRIRKHKFYRLRELGRSFAEI